MCGIAGFVETPAGRGEAALAALAEAMAATLHHRGPDDAGSWSDAAAGVAVGHTRLAIIDPSPAGRQPMASADGRWIVAYNGEVYNAAELRRELEAAGHRFRGRSDTEVIVEGCAEWGVRATAERLIGMFAAAAWDRRERRLFLVRDRLGIKPLYWARTAGAFLFGSELKALRRHPACPDAVDRDAVVAYLRHNYVPAPRTILDGVRKLEPGRILAFDGGEPAIEAYWSLDDAVAAGRTDPFAGDAAEATDALESLLADAVGRRLVADVPLGAHLSGGIDSSTVVALMQARSPRPVRTFTVGFAEDAYDEARHAAAVAEHLGTDHTELTVTAAEARDAIPLLPEIYDEPFADSSQIPTCLIARLTRRHVTVALTGDGGDELFGGYTRYAVARRFGVVIDAVPRPLRALGARALQGLSPRAWDALFRLVPESRRPAHAGDRLHKLAAVLPGGRDALYRGLISQWWAPEEAALGGVEPDGILWDPGVRGRVPDATARMQYLDTLTYLPDDILTKVDRASMAASLEARVPLLDHRVVEFAWRLPMALKVRGGTGKWILRRVLERYVPPRLTERPKMGFGAPVGDWLRGPLRDWAEDLLDERRIDEAGLVRPGPVRRRWREHLSGARDWQYALWTVLMLQAWDRHRRTPPQRHGDEATA